MTSRFFPVITIPEEERCKSVNYARISASSKSFRAVVRANQAALALLELRQKCLLEKSRRNYSISLQKDDITNWKEIKEPDDANTLYGAPRRPRELVNLKELRSSDDDDDEVFEAAGEGDQDRKNSVLVPRNTSMLVPHNTSMPAQRNSRSANVEKLVKRAISKYRKADRNSDDANDIDKSCNDVSSKMAVRVASGRIDHDERGRSWADNRHDSISGYCDVHGDVSGRTQNKPRRDKESISRSGRRAPNEKKSDDLLLKLSKSLPTHMILKSKDSQNSASDALGFTKRNKKILERERRFNEKHIVHDVRFR